MIPRYFIVAERDHELQNPTSAEKLLDLGKRLRLDSGSRVLDIASGRGGPAILLAREFGCRIDGIEIALEFHAVAVERARAAGLEHLVSSRLEDASQVELVQESYDVAMCLGASFVWGSLAGTLDALEPVVRPGGHVVVGEPFWRRLPLPEDYEERDAPFTTLEDTVTIMESGSLEVVSIIASSEDDWDRYETQHWRAVEEWLADERRRSRGGRHPRAARALQAHVPPPRPRRPRVGDLRRLEAAELGSGAAMAHPDIPAEQAYLDHAYECLEQMRQALLRTVDAAVIGADGASVSLDQAYAWVNRRLVAYEAAEQILCFGRIDVGAADDSLYVGRRWVHDDDGVLVVNWQAPAARPFYTATPAEPHGVTLRRRFRLKGRTLTGISDEALDGSVADAASTLDDFLLEELERARDARMRDIVATIQADQYGLIAREPEPPLVIQGGPGTGKTAVGLHRASYLLFSHRAALRRVLMVGPNPVFMDYVSHVLPSLGEEAVDQLGRDRARAGRAGHARRPSRASRL